MTYLLHKQTLRQFQLECQHQHQNVYLHRFKRLHSFICLFKLAKPTYLQLYYISMNREAFKNIAKELATLDIEQLPLHQMKQWLSKIQQKCHKLTTSQHQSSLCKSKTIRKFHDKASFKEYIKKKMPAIVSRSLNTVVPTQSSNAPLARIKNKARKPKSKKSIQLYQNAKYKRFVSRLEDVLKKWNLQELNCPICLQTMVSPALTACGHIFCLECIDESLLFSSACPNCRENIKSSQPILCSTLNNLIWAKVFVQQTQTEQFEERLVKYEKWAKGRFLNYDRVAPGSEIDVRDTENIWCRGQIMKVYSKVHKQIGQIQTTAFLIHYSRWDKLYNQIIDVPSHRLAPLSCFSSREDIPRYNLTQDDGNLRGSVVTGLNIRSELNTHINLFLRDFNHHHDHHHHHHDEVDEQGSSEYESEGNFQSDENEQYQEDEEQGQEESQEQQQRVNPTNREEQRLEERAGYHYRNQAPHLTEQQWRDFQNLLRMNHPQQSNQPQQVDQSQQSQEPAQSPEVEQRDEQPPQEYQFALSQSSGRMQGGQPSQQIWNFDSPPLRMNWMQHMNDHNEDEAQRQNENESDIFRRYQ